MAVSRWHEFGFMTPWGLADVDGVKLGFTRWMHGHVITFLRHDTGRPPWAS